MHYRCTFHTTQDPTCINCKHFMLHYIYDSINRGFAPIEQGHCMEPRIKNRRAADTCPIFTPREEPEGED